MTDNAKPKIKGSPPTRAQFVEILNKLKAEFEAPAHQKAMADYLDGKTQ